MKKNPNILKKLGEGRAGTHTECADSSFWLTTTSIYEQLEKQATNDEVVEIRSAIAGLQKGELIIKDQMAFALGMGSKYKKICVTHLI